MTHRRDRHMSRRTFVSGLTAAAGVSAVAGVAASAAARRPPPADPGRLRAVRDRARQLDQLHTLLISVRGELLLAEAFRGGHLDRPANVKSVAKTIMAALAGAAIDRGVFEGVDQKVAPLLGDLVPRDADPRVGEITVEDLLTMRAGLQRTSGPRYGEWVKSRNWVRYALSREFVDEPGGRMLYSTGSYHLLSAALTRGSGRSTLALAREWLGDPLEIEIPPWTRDPQGIYMGGNNMALTPRAMVKFGEMYRRGGVGDNGRVLPASWIDASWTPRTLSPFSGDRYGYGWFLRSMTGHAARYARGYGGQMIYVVPEVALTVAVTSDPTRPARSGGYISDLHRLMEELIIPLAAGTA